MVSASLPGLAALERKGKWGESLGGSLWSHLIDKKFAHYITTPNEADLKFLRDLMAEGKVKPFVEKTYPMAETANALRYFEQSHARGKIVITVE